jgi:hypothetical protein
MLMSSPVLAETASRFRLVAQSDETERGTGGVSVSAMLGKNLQGCTQMLFLL